MLHLQNALNVFSGRKIQDKNFTDFISVENNVLTVKIQDGVISENGVNGIQATDLLEYVNEVFKSLDSAFPCRENLLTITKIEEGLHWQEARTKDRIKRKVEGQNKA